MKIPCLLLLAIPTLWAGPVLLLANKEGQSFEAEILAADDDSVKVRRSSDRKVFELPLTTFDDATLLAIEKARKALGEMYPNYESEVSIGKRRKSGDSYYLKTQDITATVKITNTHRTLASPEVTARMVFLGQDQSQPSKFQVLATRDFKVSPEPDSTVELELRPFSTTYDSDNEGEGNIGGYKYDGYVLILYKKDNSIAHFKTTNSRYGKAIDMNVGLLDRYRTIKEETIVGENLLPFGEQPDARGDVIDIAE